MRVCTCVCALALAACSGASDPGFGSGGSSPGGGGGSSGAAGGSSGASGSSGSSGGGGLGASGAAGAGGSGGSSGSAGQAGSGGKSGGGGTSGGSGASGQSGSAGSGGDAFFGASRCAGGSFLLCDDFERTDPLAGGVWTADSADGTGVIDTTRFARGARSLHVHTASHGNSMYVLSETRALPAAGSALFGRAFIYFAAPPPQQVNTVLIGGNGTLNQNETLVRLALVDGALVPEYIVIGGSEIGINPLPPPILATDRWVCLEWEYASDTNELHFWTDEQEITDLAVGPNTRPLWRAPVYSSFQIGLELHQSDNGVTGFDVWYDEVAFANQRIGCVN